MYIRCTVTTLHYTTCSMASHTGGRVGWGSPQLIPPPLAIRFECLAHVCWLKLILMPQPLCASVVRMADNTSDVAGLVLQLISCVLRNGTLTVSGFVVNSVWHVTPVNWGRSCGRLTGLPNVCLPCCEHHALAFGIKAQQ